MNWLTDNKIPVGRFAGDGFDWLERKGAFFFDALAPHELEVRIKV